MGRALVLWATLYGCYVEDCCVEGHVSGDVVSVATVREGSM